MDKLSLFFLSLILLVIVSCSENQKSNFLVDQNQKYIQLDSEQKERYLDSLKIISYSLSNDSLTRSILFNLSSEYYFLNRLQKSFDISNRIFQLSSEANDSLDIAKSLYYMGDCFEVNKKDSAYFYYRKAEKIYEILENREMMSKMYYNKAYLLFYEGNYLESEIQVSRSLKLIKSSNNKQVIFTCYNLLASNFEKMEEYDEALKYYLLAKQILPDLKKNNEDFDTRNNYSLMISGNIANVYEKQGQYYKAKNELESILTMDIKKNWPNDYSFLICNLGYIKTKLGNLKEGEALMKEALFLSRKSSIDSRIVYKLHNLGKYYFDIKDTIQSTRYLKESLQLAEKLKSTDDVKVNLQLLSKIDKTNTSSYDKRYIAVSDSLTKVQRKNRNKYARIEYETAIVEDANKELSSRNLYLIFGVFVLVGTLGIRYVVSQRKEIAYRKKLQKAELEFFELMQSSQIALNEAKKEEQNRISRELHDNVMNRLYGTRLQLGMLNSITNIEAEEKRLEQINSLQVIEHDIRAISHDLHTDDVAYHFDFAVLLSQCVQQASSTTTTSLHFECNSEIDWESISGLIKITIYRIVQESLSNVVKYAAATECMATITKPNVSSLLLIISDNGNGFDLAQTSTGIGLKNMSERARLVKADFRIQSTVGQGTTIECLFVV